MKVLKVEKDEKLAIVSLSVCLSSQGYLVVNQKNDDNKPLAQRWGVIPEGGEWVLIILPGLACIASLVILNEQISFVLRVRWKDVRRITLFHVETAVSIQKRWLLGFWRSPSDADSSRHSPLSHLFAECI
jgi:hypothetical protein